MRYLHCNDSLFPFCLVRYDIKALIGRGSFSRVVRVEHRATRQPFAIKMMEVEAPEGREVCVAELAVLQRVSHTNVIQLIEVFQFPQRVYMVLELATGGELLERVISRGHFTERDATQALRMVLAGVGYLHNLGITHRDLKPENLLYYHPGADSRLLVTDFGLATFGSTGVESEIPDTDGSDRADHSWSLRTTCGTPEYMAPEVLLRRPYSCAVDMWALGVIAYIVLSGSMPFEDDSRTRLYRSIIRGKYSFHGDVSLLGFSLQLVFLCSKLEVLGAKIILLLHQCPLHTGFILAFIVAYIKYCLYSKAETKSAEIMVIYGYVAHPASATTQWTRPRNHSILGC